MWQGSIKLSKDGLWFFLAKTTVKYRWPKIALNSISFIFLSYWITLDLHLTLEDSHKKELHERNMKKHILK